MDRQHINRRDCYVQSASFVLAPSFATTNRETWISDVLKLADEMAAKEEATDTGQQELGRRFGRALDLLRAALGVGEQGPVAVDEWAQRVQAFLKENSPQAMAPTGE